MTLRVVMLVEIEDVKNKIVVAWHVELSKVNFSDPWFVMLMWMCAKDVVIYGMKVANLGEIVMANLEGVRVLQGFGVGFFYYDQHMRQNKLYELRDAMLADPQWKDPTWRKLALERLRKAVQDAPIDQRSLDLIYER